MEVLILVNIDLDTLLSTTDYTISLDKMTLSKNDHYSIDMYFYGSKNETHLLTGDPSRDYFLVRFEKYAVFMGTLEEHGINEEELLNTHPIVKVSNSKFLNFTKDHMKTEEIYTERGARSHYVIRTFDQEFHILSYEEPIVMANINDPNNL